MSPIYVAGVAALGLLAPRSDAVRRVPQGQPYDVVFPASADFPNPLQDVDLTAVLQGPNGQELIVPGFWDGGRMFRVRFTLTAAGEWSYMTVSSDSALDAQAGMLDAAPAPAVRAFANVAPGATAAPRPSRRQISACDPDCSVLFDAKNGLPDLDKLRALDTTIAQAQRDGELVDVRLFAKDSHSEVPDPHAYGIVEYLVARYAAFPNVTWCAGSPNASAGAGSRAALRGLVRTLDPYFSVNGWRRPIFASCELPFPGDRK